MIGAHLGGDVRWHGVGGFKVMLGIGGQVLQYPAYHGFHMRNTLALLLDLLTLLLKQLTLLLDLLILLIDPFSSM